MELFERLNLLIDQRYERSAAKLAERLDVHPNTFRGYLSAEGQDKIKFSLLTRILEVTPHLCREWLLFGEEPMFSAVPRGKLAEAAEAGPAYEIKSLGRNGLIRRAEVVRGAGEVDFGYLIDVHAEAGAGPASARWEPEVIATVCIPPEYAKPGVFGLRIRGDSMEPLIKRGAFVGVDSEDRDYVSGDIYAVFIPYEGLTVKRIFHDPATGEYVLRSINPDHPDMRLPIAQSERLIVGRVVWVLQKF